MRVFNKAEILIPKKVDMEKWSVIACDQFTSEPEYWAKAVELVGEAPSTLNMIFPEAYIGKRDETESAKEIYKSMERYVSGELFESYKDSLVYIERTLASGKVRRGLIGTIDLDSYDWAEGTKAAVRATEGTIESRLPTRVAMRRGAELEIPHIMVFINDKTMEIIPSASGGEELYDFILMQGGGKIKGSLVQGTAADAVLEKLDGMEGEICYAMGDGNHSLAAAKSFWEQLKPTLSEKEREIHPAGRALVELVNIYDEAVEIEPIHRLVFDSEAANFIDSVGEFFSESKIGHELKIFSADGEKSIYVDGCTIGELVDKVDEFCVAYTAKQGGEIDYIHGDDTAESMGKKTGSGAILLPPIEKSALFSSVEKSGPFPKKSFSIGQAQDKRYYLECRKIT